MRATGRVLTGRVPKQHADRRYYAAATVAAPRRPHVARLLNTLYMTLSHRGIWRGGCASSPEKFLNYCGAFWCVIINIKDLLLHGLKHVLEMYITVITRTRSSRLNRFRTEQGHGGACRRKWRLTDTDLSLWL